MDQKVTPVLKDLWDNRETKVIKEAKEILGSKAIGDLMVPTVRVGKKVLQALRVTMEILGLRDRKELKEKQDHRELKEQETSASVVMKRNQELRFQLVLVQMLM